MERHRFTIDINATKETVWQMLWGEETYPLWTSAFSEGSAVQTDGWKKGSKVVFHDGKGSGMVSIVEENIENQSMVFKHIGMVCDGVEDTTSDKIKDWAGSQEIYTLSEDNGTTHLVVELDMDEKWIDYFQKTWPLALDKLKQIAENKTL